MSLISRGDCPMRHENGNCTVAGGFCTAVNDPICEALHNAYECGRQHYFFEDLVRCKDCEYSRERNDDEREYLAENVLICTSRNATDSCWNPVWPEHFCSYGR